MIRPLRRRHQWILRGLLVLLLVAATLAFVYPAPDERMEYLPPQIVSGAEPDVTR